MAFLAGDDARATQRWHGFQTALRDLGQPEPRRLVIDRSIAAAAEAVPQLNGIDGMFAANDAHAIGLLSALRRVHLVCDGAASDQAVAVVGLGDIEMGRQVTPRLSTVRVHGYTVGRAAAQLVLDLSGPHVVDVGFELLLREGG